MNINDLAKLVLFVGLTVSCVGISIQIMRLLGAITDNVKDFRRTVKNMGKLTEGLIENQRLISEGIESFVEVGKRVKGMVDLVSTKIVKPITLIFGFLTTVNQFLQSATGKLGLRKRK